MQLTKSKTYTTIPISKLQSHLQISSDDNSMNEILQDYLESAVDEAEKYCNGRDIAPTTTTITVDSVYVPFTYLNYCINQPNISGLTITLTDTAGNSSTVTSFKVERNNTFTLIWFNQSITGSKLVISYTSGYQTYSAIPKGIVQAIRIKVAEYLDGDKLGYVYNATPTRQFERVLSPYVL